MPFLIRASSGRVASRLYGLPVLLLSTTGAKSGQTRTTLWVPRSSSASHDQAILVDEDSPADACPDWQRLPTRTAQPSNTARKAPSRQSRPPPQLARLLRWHLRGLRVRRRWAAVPGCPRWPAQWKPLWPGLAPGPRRSHAGRRDRHLAGRRPDELRHAALSLWLASGAPPAEIAARAGHSVRVLLTIYAHCIPGCDLIASQQIEQALRPIRWPPAGPQEPAQTPGIVSVMRPCHSWTQRDTAGPDPSAQIRLDVCDLRKYRPGRSVPWIAAPDGRSWAPVLHKPLTRPDLAHHWPTAIGNGLPNRSRTRIRPGIREHRHRV